MADVLSQASNITINTGNMLNLIDIKKKAGQNVSEELAESLQITVADWKKSQDISVAANNNGYDKLPSKNGAVFMSRLQDDVRSKMAEEDRKNLKIGIKIFLQNDSVESLKDCLQNVYTTLGTDMVDNLVLAYRPKWLINSDGDNETKTNGATTNNEGQPEDKSDVKADTDSKCDEILPGLKNLWNELEKYVAEGRIQQLGVSDLDEQCFKTLHSVCKVKPTIIQINLASCCVVPPGLQAFCKENDVQLLTHSDPHEIISQDSLKSILGGGAVSLRWCVRYQVHIKCRGVLALKGYLINSNLDQ